MNEIIVALITGGITLVGVLLANQKTQAVMETPSFTRSSRTTHLPQSGRRTPPLPCTSPPSTPTYGHLTRIRPDGKPCNK